MGLSGQSHHVGEDGEYIAYIDDGDDGIYMHESGTTEGEIINNQFQNPASKGKIDYSGGGSKIGNSVTITGKRKVKTTGGGAEGGVNSGFGLGAARYNIKIPNSAAKHGSWQGGSSVDLDFVGSNGGVPGIDVLGAVAGPVSFEGFSGGDVASTIMNASYDASTYSVGEVLNYNYTRLTTSDNSVTGNFHGVSLGFSVLPATYTSSKPGGSSMTPFYFNATFNNRLSNAQDSLEYAKRHANDNAVFTNFLKQ